MQITTYNFAKEPNSTKQPSSGGTDHSVVLKEPCSLMHPVFKLHGFSHTDNYVKWGSRYYFIEDIVQVTNDIAEYHCREDVLATYKSYIGSSSQYITRSSHAYTGNLIDSRYPALTQVTKTETELNALHTSISGNGFFVLGVQNGQSVSSGGLTYYGVTYAMMQSLLEFMFGGTWLDTSGQSISVALQKELINPMQYISSCMWFPFPDTMLSDFTPATIKFGWWPAENVIGHIIPAGAFVQVFSENVTLPRHPNANTRGIFLNGAPFTRYTLFCYSFGQIPIDANLFIDVSSCIVGIAVDLSTGDAKLDLTEGSGAGKLVYQTPGKFGCEVQLSQLTQSILGMGSSVISGAVGMAYGNFVGFGQGIVSGLDALMPQSTIKGSNGSRMWYYKKPTLLTEHRNLASEDNAHLGRPLCVRGTVQSYPGFLQVENADIDFACNYAELTEIKSALETGIYYE